MPAPRFARPPLVLSALACGVVSALVSGLGCAGVDPKPGGSPVALASPGSTDTDIAAVHRARCGACHVPVMPGARSRDALEVALLRHRKRVHMIEADWTLMLDYLASRPKTP